MRKLYVKCELCSLCANPVIIGGYRELAAQATDFHQCIGHPSLAAAYAG